MTENNDDYEAIRGRVDTSGDRLRKCSVYGKAAIVVVVRTRKLQWLDHIEKMKEYLVVG